MNDDTDDQDRDPSRGRPPRASWENQSKRKPGRAHDRQQAVHQCAATGESYHCHHLKLFSITAVINTCTLYARPTVTSLMSSQQLQRR